MLNLTLISFITCRLAFEMQQFMDLISGEDSQGMRYAFFSERLASVVPGLNPKEALDIKKVGVIGGGLMGSGIAMAFLNRGFTVLKFFLIGLFIR